MADNLALKLLVAGIIGAVVGAAAAEKYHFPTGLVYGPFNSRPAPPYGRPIDPVIGSGDVGEVRGGPRVVLVPEFPPELPPERPRYRAPRNPPARATTAWCLQEYENWNFATAKRWVPCRPGGRQFRDDY
jgi:hypothetical protein